MTRVCESSKKNRLCMVCMTTAQYISKRETRVGYRTGDHKGPPSWPLAARDVTSFRVGYRTGDHEGLYLSPDRMPPASSPRFTCPPDRVPLRYGEAARAVRVSLSANLLIWANIYILFIVRSATFMRRLFPFDYTFIIATRHSSFLAANSVGRENILLSRVAKK